LKSEVIIKWGQLQGENRYIISRGRGSPLFMKKLENQIFTLITWTSPNQKTMTGTSAMPSIAGCTTSKNTLGGKSMKN
jgi:hypothetical protein